MAVGALSAARGELRVRGTPRGPPTGAGPRCLGLFPGPRPGLQSFPRKFCSFFFIFSKMSPCFKHSPRGLDPRFQTPRPRVPRRPPLRAPFFPRPAPGFSFLKIREDGIVRDIRILVPFPSGGPFSPFAIFSLPTSDGSPQELQGDPGAGSPDRRFVSPPDQTPGPLGAKGGGKRPARFYLLPLCDPLV